MKTLAARTNFTVEISVWSRKQCSSKMEFFYTEKCFLFFFIKQCTKYWQVKFGKNMTTKYFIWFPFAHRFIFRLKFFISWNYPYFTFRIFTFFSLSSAVCVHVLLSLSMCWLYSFYIQWSGDKLLLFGLSLIRYFSFAQMLFRNTWSLMKNRFNDGISRIERKNITINEWMQGKKEIDPTISRQLEVPRFDFPLLKSNAAVNILFFCWWEMRCYVKWTTENKSILS